MKPYDGAGFGGAAVTGRVTANLLKRNAPTTARGGLPAS